MMDRRRALMMAQKGEQEENMIDFRSININGVLRAKSITITSNSVSNVSQIWTHLDSYLESGEKALMFAATSFTNQENGIKYGFRKGLGIFFSNSTLNSMSTFGRYKNGSIVEITNDASSYDGKLKAGDTYFMLYEEPFTKNQN